MVHYEIKFNEEIPNEQRCSVSHDPAPAPPLRSGSSPSRCRVGELLRVELAAALNQQSAAPL